MTEFKKELQKIKFLKLEIDTLSNLKNNSDEEMENVILEMIENSIVLKRRVLDVLNRLENPLMRVILIERYFNNLPWKILAINFRRSETWVRWIHDKAIKLCEDMF